EAQRQHAGSERIETAGMPGLLGIEQPANLLQRGVGRKATRLVEENDAADCAAHTFYLGHALLSITMLAVFGDGTLDQRGQLDTATDTGVIVEMQLRYRAQLHRLAQLHAQEAARLVENAQVLDRKSVVVVLAHDG